MRWSAMPKPALTRPGTFHLQHPWLQDTSAGQAGQPRARSGSASISAEADRPRSPACCRGSPPLRTVTSRGTSRVFPGPLVHPFGKSETFSPKLSDARDRAGSPSSARGTAAIHRTGTPPSNANRGGRAQDCAPLQRSAHRPAARPRGWPASPTISSSLHRRARNRWTLTFHSGLVGAKA